MSICGKLLGRSFPQIDTRPPPVENRPSMIVLAIETVTRRGSLALLTDAGCEVRTGNPARTNGERLPGDVLALLADAHHLLAGVDRFAIVAGPGSFTGLRVGMAVVQGLALATGRPVAPVPTLEAVAEGWRSGRTIVTAAAEPGTRAPGREYVEYAGRDAEPAAVIACLDGQRGDVFFAAWKMTRSEPIEDATPIIPPTVGSPEDLVRQVRAEIVGPARIVGVGIGRHAAALAALALPTEEIVIPLAEVAARIAARRPDLAGRPHALRPIYVRRPDAVLARERARMSRPTGRGPATPGDGGGGARPAHGADPPSKHRPV